MDCGSQKRQLGRTGLDVSILGLGGHTYGPNTQPWRKFLGGRQFVVVPAGSILPAAAADETVECRPWSSKRGSSSWWRWPVG